MIPHQYSTNVDNENYNFLDKSASRNTNERVTTLLQDNHLKEPKFVAVHHPAKKFLGGDKDQHIHGCKKLMLAADDKYVQQQLLNNNNNKLAPESKRKSEKDFVQTGDLVENRFQVIKKLCQLSDVIQLPKGGFGQVYTAIDLHSNEQVALKLEKKDEECAAASIECKVLRRLSGRKHCPVLYSYGENEVFTFVAMQLLGKSLSDIRRDCNLKPQRMSIKATLNVATQCLSALQTLHDIGYLHRDVKPSNFAVGSSYRDVDTVYIIDFGLCRRYLESNSQIKAPRENVGFRGTVRYASLNAHQGMRK
uniref:Protein kinase domain-containing protein n=1 Tax=Romanomermis culicivorax TaxID=13658 RepID=A0A915JDF6_ROMCU